VPARRGLGVETAPVARGELVGDESDSTTLPTAHGSAGGVLDHDLRRPAPGNGQVTISAATLVVAAMVAAQRKEE
jgi:hypothetical protein